MDEYQPIRLSQTSDPTEPVELRPKRFTRPSIGLFVLLVCLAVYFFIPGRTNILLLGTDDSPARGTLGRTDTIILTGFNPLSGYVGMLGIPRDLWVNVPNVGEQRINTAYFFAEGSQPGTGSGAAMQTVQQNFGVHVDYYLLIHMDGVVQLVDALGGVTITLEARMGGLEPGEHTLDGTQALAFARERYSADDFSRMKQGQILLRAVLARMLNPLVWPRLPQVGLALASSVKTDVPVLLLPRLGLTLLRAGLVGIDSRSISREMVFPFQTNAGAQVLAPNWEQINPVLKEMFGE